MITTTTRDDHDSVYDDDTLCIFTLDTFCTAGTTRTIRIARL